MMVNPAGPTLVVALILSSTLPPSFRPMPTGDVPGGMPAIWFRGVVCLVGGLVLRLASTDPASRRPVSVAPRRPRPPRAPGSLGRLGEGEGNGSVRAG